MNLFLLFSTYYCTIVQGATTFLAVAEINPIFDNYISNLKGNFSDIKVSGWSSRFETPSFILSFPYFSSDESNSSDTDDNYGSRSNSVPIFADQNILNSQAPSYIQILGNTTYRVDIDGGGSLLVVFTDVDFAESDVSRSSESSRSYYLICLHFITSNILIYSILFKVNLCLH